MPPATSCGCGWPVRYHLHLAAVGHRRTPVTCRSPEAGQPTAISHARQIPPVQLWFPADGRLGWTGLVDQCEMAGLLLFGLPVSPHHLPDEARTRARGLMARGVVAARGCAQLASGRSIRHGAGCPGIATQFAAGALACAAVRRLRPTDAPPQRRVPFPCWSASRLSASYLLHAHPLAVEDSGGVVDAVPIARDWRRQPPPALSTRFLAGRSCLYMVHELVHTAWDGRKQ